ncbi:hypothetical protein PMI07_000804 [Rhizobium sp. CF080]|uniref:hypothetical protein n=1 Tax=Rhizobium sp. (strain CF080) TaxID=1144310 RepID=UPI000271D60A|nr:hypothetical protein [Rhizobium sp. CF080]EUB97228.1 hypothetical protein PMI07_000804 [Rhizobium sp. CF080]
MPYACEWTPTMRLVDSDGYPTGSYIIQFVVGKAAVGSVFWSIDGTYYPTTQLRRFGAIGDLEYAKGLVETWGLYDALTYPTVGNA